MCSRARELSTRSSHDRQNRGVPLAGEAAPSPLRAAFESCQDEVHAGSHDRHEGADARRPGRRMTRRWRLFPKYALLIITLVGSMLVASGAIGIYFSWRESKAHLDALQDEKARNAANRIEQYILDIEHQLSWTALAARRRRRRRARAASHRIPEAAAPGAGDHRGRLDRPRGPRATAHLAPGDGRDPQRHRPVAREEVPGPEAEEGTLLRPGLLPQGHRAVHDDRASRPAAAAA